MCNCYFELIVFLIILFGTQQSGIRAKVRIEAMAVEKGKVSGIENFDGTNFQ